MTNEHEHSDTGAHHITHPSVYWRVYWLLMLFMALTYGAAMVQMGPLNNVIAMVIAITKATLVVLFFMQVKYASKLTWMWAACGFVWLVIMFLTLGDYVTKHWTAVSGW